MSKCNMSMPLPQYVNSVHVHALLICLPYLISVPVANVDGPCGFTSTTDISRWCQRRTGKKRRACGAKARRLACASWDSVLLLITKDFLYASPHPARGTCQSRANASGHFTLHITELGMSALLIGCASFVLTSNSSVILCTL
ncbi:hypothetical protein DFH11DRAFT_888472 [Phellopilus nigrolimitatus]|nr:hypothetical protein DFH11DRAFT_888472 [Phellopilus nigrolimitatus]